MSNPKALQFTDIIIRSVGTCRDGGHKITVEVCASDVENVREILGTENICTYAMVLVKNNGN